MPRVKVFGKPEPRALEQLERCLAEADYGVLCADNHVGYSMPIGGAAAYEHHISPSGVGFDVGCGNKAARTPYRAEFVRLTMHPIDKQRNFVAAAIAAREKAKFVGTAHVKKEAGGASIEQLKNMPYGEPKSDRKNKAGED